MCRTGRRGAASVAWILPGVSDHVGATVEVALENDMQQTDHEHSPSVEDPSSSQPS